MRCLFKNKRTIYFKLYSGITQIVDDDGLKTGEYEATYGDLKSMMANVSPAQGSTSAEPFGLETNYSKIIVTDDMSCPITESSILWLDASTSGAHDYVVVKVAKSLNSISYAVREVDYSE